MSNYPVPNYPSYITTYNILLEVNDIEMNPGPTNNNETINKSN